MTIQEIQEIIDNQEFKRLSGDDTSFWMGFNAFTLTKVTFTHELFKWMFTKENYRNWHYIVNAPLDLFQKMTTGYYYQANLEEMKYFIDFVQSVSESSYIGSYRFNNMKEYPDGTFDYIVKQIKTNSNISFHRIIPKDSDMQTLSDESKVILGDYLTNKGRVRKLYSHIRTVYTNYGYDNIIRLIGKERFKDFIEWTSYEHNTHFRQHQLIKDAMTPEEIFQWIDELHTKKMHTLLQYVPKYFNSDIEVSDDIIEKLIEMNNDDTITIQGESMKHFTKEQFKRITMTKIYAYYILNTKDGKLEDYVELADEETQRRESYSIIRAGRFTEEEILKYPAVFVPEHMNDDSGLYFSKDTLKVLNKTHGKRQRYYEDEQKFVRLILSNMRRFASNGFNKEYFFYLIEKTKPSNEEILQVLYTSKKHSNSPLTPYSALVDLVKEEK